MTNTKEQMASVLMWMALGIPTAQVTTIDFNNAQLTTVRIRDDNTIGNCTLCMQSEDLTISSREDIVSSSAKLLASVKPAEVIVLSLADLGLSNGADKVIVTGAVTRAESRLKHAVHPTISIKLNSSPGYPSIISHAF